MRELMERNGVEPDDFVSVILTCTDDLNAQFPAVGARAVGLDRVPLLCNRELDVPGAMERVIRVLAHYYAAPGAPARARLSRRDAEAARRPALRAVAVSRRVLEKARGDPRLRRRSADRQGAGIARRRGHRPARLERVAVRARTRRSPRRSRAPPAPPTAIPTRARPCFVAGSPSATRSSRAMSRSPTAPARSCWRRRWRCASPAPSSSTAGPRSRCTRCWRRCRERARSGSSSATAGSTTSTRSPPRSPPRRSWS